MIRWQFIGFRLLLLIAVLMLLRWTAGPVAHWLLVQSLESSTGAKVEIASTEFGLFPPRLHLVDVKLADPRKEMKNAIEMQDIYLAIDGSAFLRRRYEIAAGRISGIRVGTSRTESGWLEVVEEEAEPDESAGPSLLEQWCEKLAGDASNRTDAFIEELQTLAESRRIRESWEAEYNGLRSKSKQLEDDIRRLKSTVRKVENPLRDLPALQESLKQVEDVRRELLAVRQQLDTLPSRARGDLDALQAAKRADQEKVAAYLPTDLRPDSAAKLGPELLGKIVRDQLQTVRAYLDSGRSIAQVTIASPTALRQRGETILLGPQSPFWLVRRCEVDGFLSVNDDEYNMQGVIENITSDTDNLQAPLHARLRLEGPRVVRIDYERFYDSVIPRDHLKIHWPSLDLPKNDLGSRKAALAVAGGKLQLWVDVNAQGDQISGRLVSKQTDTRLGLITEPKLESNVIVQSLKRKLDEIDHIDVDARFVGTWKKMDLDISTSLTGQITASMQSVVQDTMIAARAKLSGEVDRLYQQQANELSTWLNRQQSDARQLLAGVDTAIESVSKNVMSELSAPDAYLSRLRSGVGRVLK